MLAALLVAMAALFVAALVVPTAFIRHALLFGFAFLVVTLMHITLYALAARDDPDLLRPSCEWPAQPSPSDADPGRRVRLRRPAGHCSGWSHSWSALFGPALSDVSAWRLHPAHFVERHSLIIIIALGESLIAVGLGTRQTSLSATVIIAALLGLAIATSFWIAYFDFFAIRFRHLLAEQHGAAQVALARDAYSYLHLPMVAGIVLSAFALREAVARIGHDLATVPALALCGGSALYLASYVAIRWRLTRNAPQRPASRFHRVHSPLPTHTRNTSDRSPRRSRRNLDRAPRLRDHLVARSPQTNTRPPHHNTLKPLSDNQPANPNRFATDPTPLTAPTRPAPDLPNRMRKFDSPNELS